MKKFTAILVAVILISANLVMACAADVYTCPTCNRKFDEICAYNACIDKHIADGVEEPKQATYKCATCSKSFTDLDSYNACVGSHFNNVNYHYDKYVGLTIPELLAELVNIFNKTGTMDTVQNLVDKLFELTSLTIEKRTFSCALSDLESEVDKLEFDDDCLTDINNIINVLKEKYRCNEDTSETEIEVTEGEPPADTGSSVGVGLFAVAAISAAMAATYVTTVKKD